jgi:hypothetical protein
MLIVVVLNVTMLMGATCHYAVAVLNIIILSVGMMNVIILNLLHGNCCSTS